MIIDVLKLRQKGKKEENIEFLFDISPDLLQIPSAVFSTQGKICALVEVYDNEVYVSGTLTYQVTAPCSRCLKQTVITQTVEFDERFLPESRMDEEEDLALIYKRDKIDLTDYINELILTDLPISVLCKEDCKGLCPQCGMDLNTGDCGHHIE